MFVKTGSWADVQFLDTATEQLIDCRRTLKYTYVYAFYLKAGPEKDLFEYLQEGLERSTEDLSYILEHSHNMSSQHRRRVLDLTELANTKLNHLLEGVKDGLLNE
eukprot:TRINITY_DN2432_c0_g1_i1.p3 TRINITY_DN2432_c0_g1~~TRINITY_DN2432_c0_g1_i1.p3  ORF type:complete len:105 (-),score=29.93 TRINITY_DN2432_c0_g1_i1:228-542(-)